MITATSSLGLLQYWPIDLSKRFVASKYWQEFWSYAMIITGIPFTFGIINFVPQLCFEFDIVSYISSKIPKSNASSHYLISQFCSQNLSLIFHIVNMMRFIKGNAFINTSNRKKHLNKWSFKSVIITIILVPVAIVQICYILMIFGGICGFIFSTLRIMLMLSTFLICYATYFPMLIIVTVPYIVNIKATFQTYHRRKTMVRKAIRNCHQKLEEKTNQLQKHLSLNQSAEIDGKITLYIRINHHISESINPSSVQLLQTNNTKYSMSIINNWEQASIDSEAASNLSCLIGNNELTICQETHNESGISKKKTYHYDTSYKWDILLYAGKTYWEILPHCSDQNTRSQHGYKIAKDKSMTVNVKVTDSEFRRLKFDCETQCLKMTWNTSSNHDYSPFFRDPKSKMAVEVDVPEILMRIKHVIHAKLLEIVKFNQSHLNYDTYKIIIQYKKTENQLKLKLPSCNNDYFYFGCNRDLILLLGHVGRYLQKWDSKIFCRNLDSNIVYYDLSTMEDMDVIGIPQNLFDYICDNVTNLTMSCYVAVAKVIFGTIFYFFLVIAIFGYNGHDSPATFFSSMSNTSISLSIIIVILGFIRVSQHDEKKMNDRILQVLFAYKRGYKLVDTPHISVCDPSWNRDIKNTCHRWCAKLKSNCNLCKMLHQLCQCFRNRRLPEDPSRINLINDNTNCVVV